MDVTHLSQRDKRWSHIRLGRGSVTIGGYGCAITSIAMLINTLRGNADLHPHRVNADMLGSGAFGGPWGNYVIWPEIPRLYADIIYSGRIYCREEPASVDELAAIDSRLAAGIPMIIEVDLSPVRAGYQQHFVLAVERTNGNYLIADPWQTEFGITELCPAYGREARYAVCGAILYDRARS